MDFLSAPKGIRPSHRFCIDELLNVHADDAPEGYEQKWQSWRREAMLVQPKPSIRDAECDHGKWRVFDVRYTSTDRAELGGWLLLPKLGHVERGFIIGHGYAGRDEPDFQYTFENAAIFFPCARGLGRSKLSPISPDPRWHVRHDIDKPDSYVLRGCVEDVWLAVSALLRLEPQLEGRIAYMGGSFGGGVGAMALAWEDRIARAHFCMPSFGYQMLRLKLKTLGSAASIQTLYKKEPSLVTRTLKWYDAAYAARYIRVPVHVACALSDPVVAPPGQFAVFNALAGEKQLFTLRAGHMSYPEQEREMKELQKELEEFFSHI